jgi:hypothetical protein
MSDLQRRRQPKTKPPEQADPQDAQIIQPGGQQSDVTVPAQLDAAGRLAHLYDAFERGQGSAADRPPTKRGTGHRSLAPALFAGTGSAARAGAGRTACRHASRAVTNGPQGVDVADGMAPAQDCAWFGGRGSRRLRTAPEAAANLERRGRRQCSHDYPAGADRRRGTSRPEPNGFRQRRWRAAKYCSVSSTCARIARAWTTYPARSGSSKRSVQALRPDLPAPARCFRT